MLDQTYFVTYPAIICGFYRVVLAPELDIDLPERVKLCHIQFMLSRHLSLQLI